LLNRLLVINFFARWERVAKFSVLYYIQKIKSKPVINGGKDAICFLKTDAKISYGIVYLSIPIFANLN